MPRKRSKGKSSARRDGIAVRRPTPASVFGSTRTNKKVRSDAAWMDKDDKKNVLRFKSYLDYAPKIVLPVTLRKLRAPLTKNNRKAMEDNMKTLLAPSHPARCTSAQYVDRNGEPLLYYFGRRLLRPDDKKNIVVSAKDQYENQSVEDIGLVLELDKSVKLVRDGLNNLKCKDYQMAVQALAVDTKLHALYDDARHEGKNEMDYVAQSTECALDADTSCSDMSVSEGGSEDIADSKGLAESHFVDGSDFLVDAVLDGDEIVLDDDELEQADWEDDLMWGGDAGDIEDVDVEVEDDEINMDAYDTGDVENNGLHKTEQAGVVHLVHGWTQRGHPNQLFISGDVTCGSTRVAAAGSYYYLTESVARTVALAFKAVFPAWYRTYQEAFDAGVWFADDPGPFLGRAVVYKLQGRLHKDRHDVGPSVSFPVGQYTGGEMLFPQLNVKLQYSPGDFCIFFSSDIYHKVAPFAPLPQTDAQVAENITPGRIGSVFFFPKNSLRILKGRPKRWGYKTAFGVNEHLYVRHKDGSI